MRLWPRVQWPRHREHTVATGTRRKRRPDSPTETTSGEAPRWTRPAIANCPSSARRISGDQRTTSVACTAGRNATRRADDRALANRLTASTHASAVGHGTETQRPQVLQQAEEDVDATVQGLPAAVHRVPVQQHRHHMPGGGLHHSRRVHVHIHRGQRRHHQDGVGPAAEQPHRHRGPAVGPGVQQPQQPGRFRGHSRAAAQVLPAPRHRGGAQLQLRGHQQGEHEPMVVRRRLPLLAVRHHHHRWIVCSIHILLGIYTYIPT